MKIIFPLFLFFFLCPGLAIGQVDLTKGLIGCYPFSGNANDLSPSQNHGKVMGAILTEDRFGKQNSAYYFDGVDDFIEVDSKTLRLNTFSYSMWVSPANLPGNSQAFFLFSVGSDFGDQHILLGNQYTNGRHNSFAHGSYQGVSQNVRCSDDLAVEKNKWYHLTLCKDITTYYFYVNGRLICTNPVKVQSAFYGTTIIRAMIGARNNYGQKSNARIDDIHLYNRALNEQEILELFKGSTTTNEIELTINNPSPCGGEIISTSVNIGSNSTIKWIVDPAFIQSRSANTLILSFPEKKADYEVLIKAEVVPDSTVCFPEKPQSISKTITIKYCPPSPVPESIKLLMPSAFTPNNDGYNDELVILNWESIKDFDIYIYDRWGEVIFHSKGYDRPWDGTYQEKTVPSGIYLFKIFSQKKQINSGTVTIL